MAETMSVNDADGLPLDVLRLDSDLEFILVERANMGSDILQRVTNVQEYGACRMYAEVHKLSLIHI